MAMRNIALLLNLLLFAFFAYAVYTSMPSDMRGWLWVVAIFCFLLLNGLGLFALAGRLFAVMATLSNGVMIIGWGGMIALMMVWPMGNTPEGFELLGLLASWLALVVTEVALIRGVHVESNR